MSHGSASTSGRPPRPDPVPQPSTESQDANHVSVLHLNSAAAGDFSQQLLTVPVHINGISGTFLIDSGASRDFIASSFAKKHRLHLSTIPRPLRIRLANGTLSATDQELREAIVQLTPEASYSSSLVATSLQGFDGILGKPFLSSINPHIDWSTNTIVSPFILRGSISPPPPVQIHVITAKRMSKLIIKHRDELDLFQCRVTQISENPTLTSKPNPFFPATTLSSANEQALHHLLYSTHRSTFNEPSSVTTVGPYHRIELLPGSKPPQHRVYRMSPAELQELQRQLEIYLEKGWIRPSISEYGAPILFARKADGSLRLCVDYRSLNAMTIKDSGPLPLSSELFDQLHGAKYFTSLDLHSGYHQCRIHPDDIHKTAFKTRYGTFEFVVMPFGLTNAPAAFSRLMASVLRPFLDRFVVSFLDDVLIYSKTEEEHLDHIRQVLAAFDAANLKVKLSKCSFAQESTRFLGYIVSSKGLSVDPKKVAAVTNWSLPSDITAVRSFLGFVGFHRRFIRDFAKIAGPLTDLTRSTVPFPSVLPQAAVDSFNMLKAALVSAPLLIIPFTGPTAEFILYTDASLTGLGAVLLQDQGHGPQPVCYESRKLTPAERNYSVHELELLAIVHAVKIFRHYLEGCKHFTLHTDHHSLRYFFTQKDLSRRQARWAQDLAPYQPNMSIIYKKGEDNMADALSRLNLLTVTSGISASLLSSLAHLLPTHVTLADPILDEIKTAYSSDSLYAPENTRRPSYLHLRDSLWYFKERVCVPNDTTIRRRLLYEFHDVPTAGHSGYLKTLNALASHFWWPRMTRTVRSYVSSCATCQRIKPSTQATPGLLRPHDIPTRPWSHISMDLITDLPASLSYDGHTYNSIATFVCMLTKQAHFIRVNKTITAKQLANLFLDHIFSKHGLPKVIVSDRDTRITSEFWQAFFSALGTRLNISTAHHPQTDGQTDYPQDHRANPTCLRFSST